MLFMSWANPPQLVGEVGLTVPAIFLKKMSSTIIPFADVENHLQAGKKKENQLINFVGSFFFVNCTHKQVNL